MLRSSEHWFCGSILDDNHYEYDHLKRLNVLRTLIPKQDLIVRRHLTSSGIEQDFLSIYRLNLANGFKVNPPKNVSEVDASRQSLAVWTSERNFGGFLRDLGKQDICADDRVRYLLSPQQRRTFLQEYAQTNREVAEHYFPELNGELFEPPEEDDHWFPVSVPHPTMPTSYPQPLGRLFSQAKL